MERFEIINFDGPIDLLLQMIENHKLEISEISLAEIAEHYIKYINEMKQKINMSDISEFIYIASKLIKIKSNFMLNISREEDEETLNIISLLEEYSKYKKLSLKIKDLYKNPVEFFEKVPEDFVVEKKFELKKLKIENLPLKILQIKSDKDKKIYVKKDKKSVNEKILYIKKIFTYYDTIYFDDILEERTKEESVISMMGSLQLSNENLIELSQKENFGRIKLKNLI